MTIFLCLIFVGSPIIVAAIFKVADHVWRNKSKKKVRVNCDLKETTNTVFVGTADEWRDKYYKPLGDENNQPLGQCEQHPLDNLYEESLEEVERFLRYE